VKTDPTEFIRLMNLAKAHLENRSSKDAIEVLTRAVKLEPKSAAAQRNLARAQFLGQNFPAVLETLDAVRKLEPDSVAAHYLTGLALVRMSRFEEAIPPLEAAVRLDADSAVLRYQLASAYQSAGKHDKAKDQLAETARLDPLHASAQFKLSTYARQAGDQAEFRRRMDEFTRLRAIFGDDTRSVDALERCAYTLPESAIPERHRPSPPCDSIPVRFIDDTDRLMGDASKNIAAAVIDIDSSGRPTLFAVDPEGKASLLRVSDDGTIARRSVDFALPAGAKSVQCIVGNFHDEVPKGEKFEHAKHAFNDLVVVTSAGVRIIQRTGETAFRDVTEAAGLKDASATRAAWADYEHDGDLDLLLAGNDGLQLWQNNGNGAFENVTQKVGITSTRSASDAASADLDANVAVDVIVARGREPTLVFENQRTGRFRPMPEPPGPWPPAERVLVDDLNNDGRVDAVLVGKDGVEIRLGSTVDRIAHSFSGQSVTAAALFDYDNDGALDLALVTKGDQPAQAALRVLRLELAEKPKVSDVTEALGLATIPLSPISELIAVDVDADGDTDILAVTEDHRLRFIRNDGGNAHHQLKLRLATIKTNPSGFGTHLEVREGPFWVTRRVHQVPIEIGVCRREKLDVIQTLWTNGVVDNQIDVRVERAALTIVEKNVATGSCPLLYAWDGSRFRFVTDLLGNSPIGLPLTREQMLPADPDEIVAIGTDDDFRPRDGAFTLKITDEFREVFYVDEVKLLAVEHPAGIEVHPTDKLMFPPFPPSELWPVGKPRGLRSVRGDDGLDRTEAVRAIDGVFAPPGPPLPPPLRGMCHQMTLTLDFGPLDASRPMVLAMTGWLQYGDGSTNIALSQNSSLSIIPPWLEARDPGGQWAPVDVVVGIPAGKTKTILCDLTAKLPAGADQLRLTTTFEIRWDRIALFERVAAEAIRITEHPPAAAQLEWRGFSEMRSRAPEHPTTPDHDRVFERPPWRTALQGWCTAYGDVVDLLRARDDEMVVMNAGDALTLTFDADSIAAPRSGMKRSFFFYSVGWDKDGDHNVTDGETVEPLPVGLAGSDSDADGASAADWRFRYNTRWVPASRFQKHPGEPPLVRESLPR